MTWNPGVDMSEPGHELPGHLGAGVSKTPAPQMHPSAKSIGAQGHSTSNVPFPPLSRLYGAVPKRRYLTVQIRVTGPPRPPP